MYVIVFKGGQIFPIFCIHIGIHKYICTYINTFTYLKLHPLESGHTKATRQTELCKREREREKEREKSGTICSNNKVSLLSTLSLSCTIAKNINFFERLLQERSQGMNRLAGLPDGVFSYQKSQFWYSLEGLGMEIVGILYGHLEYFTTFWYMSWQFGKCRDHLVYFTVLVCCTKKIWQPCQWG
jgi:hypothetical protein